MVFGVYYHGSLIQYVVANDPQEAIAIATKGKEFPGVVTAVKQRSMPFDELSKEQLCRYLDLQLHVKADWGRLTKSDLMSIAASIADLKHRLWQAQDRRKQAQSVQ